MKQYTGKTYIKRNKRITCRKCGRDYFSDYFPKHSCKANKEAPRSKIQSAAMAKKLFKEE